MKKLKLLSFTVLPLALGILASCGENTDAKVKVNSGDNKVMAKLEKEQDADYEEWFKLENQNLKAGDLLSFTYKGNNISEKVIPEILLPGNNLDEDLKIVNDADAAFITLKVYKDDVYSAFVSGYDAPIPTPDKYTVSKAAVTNGTLSLSKEGELEEGDQVTATATAAEGYTLKEITINGEVASTISPFSFTVSGLLADDQDKIVVGATFKQAAVPATGISISGEDTVKVGESVTLTAAPVPEGSSFPGDVEWSVTDGNDYVSLPEVKTGTTIEVTGVAEGDATIKAKCGDLFMTFDLEVVPDSPTPVTTYGYSIDGGEVKNLTYFSQSGLTGYIYTGSLVKDQEFTFYKDGEKITENITPMKVMGNNNLLPGEEGSFTVHNSFVPLMEGVPSIALFENQGSYQVYGDGYKESYPDPTFAFVVNSQETTMTYNETDDQWEIKNAPVSTDMSITVANVGKDPYEVCTSLKLGDDKETIASGFSISKGVLTTTNNGTFSFYLVNTDTMYIVWEDKPAPTTGYFIEINDTPKFKLEDNPSASNEKMFLGAELSENEIITVYDADHTTSFMAKLDGSKIPNAFEYIDGTGIKVLISGTYDIYLKLVQDNDSIYFDANVPLPTDLTATVGTEQSSWAFDSTSKLFVGAFDSSDQVTWIHIPSTNTDSISFTVPEGTVKFLIVRTNLGTVEPNWLETEDVPGRIYNKTADQTVEAFKDTYQVTFVNYPEN